MYNRSLTSKPKLLTLSRPFIPTREVPQISNSLQMERTQDQEIYQFNQNSQKPKKVLKLTSYQFQPDSQLQNNQEQEQEIINEEIQPNTPQITQKQYFTKNELKQLVEDFKVVYNSSPSLYQYQYIYLGVQKQYFNQQQIQSYFSQSDWRKIKQRVHIRIKNLDQSRNYQNTFQSKLFQDKQESNNVRRRQQDLYNGRRGEQESNNVRRGERRGQQESNNLKRGEQELNNVRKGEEESNNLRRGEQNPYFSNKPVIKDILKIAEPQIIIKLVEKPMLLYENKYDIEEQFDNLLKESSGRNNTISLSNLFPDLRNKNDIYYQIKSEVVDLVKSKFDKGFKMITDLIQQDGYDCRNCYFEWFVELILQNLQANPQLYFQLCQKISKDTRFQSVQNKAKGNSSLINELFLKQIKKIFLSYENEKVEYFQNISHSIIDETQGLQFITQMVIQKLLDFDAIVYIFEGMISQYLLNYTSHSQNDEKPIYIIMDLLDQIMKSGLFQSKDKIDLQILERFFEGGKKSQSELKNFFIKIETKLSMQMMIVILDSIGQHYKISQKLMVLIINLKEQQLQQQETLEKKNEINYKQLITPKDEEKEKILKIYNLNKRQIIETF